MLMPLHPRGSETAFEESQGSKLWSRESEAGSPEHRWGSSDVVYGSSIAQSMSLRRPRPMIAPHSWPTCAARVRGGGVMTPRTRPTRSAASRQSMPASTLDSSRCPRVASDELDAEDEPDLGDRESPEEWRESLMQFTCAGPAPCYAESLAPLTLPGGSLQHQRHREFRGTRCSKRRHGTGQHDTRQTTNDRICGRNAATATAEGPYESRLTCAATCSHGANWSHERFVRTA